MYDERVSPSSDPRGVKPLWVRPGGKMDFIESERKILEEELKHTLLVELDHAIETLSKPTEEKVGVEMLTQEDLTAKDLVLPLQVKGTMLGPGVFKTRFYKKEQLKTAVENFKPFEIRLDHMKDGKRYVIGLVDKVEWLEDEEKIAYWGHINDETHARTVLDGLVQVSVSTLANDIYEPGLGKVGYGIKFKELSLVDEGAYPENSIEPV